MQILAARLWNFLPWVIAGVAVVLSAMTSAHAILRKRDPRSAVSWTGIIWLVPIGGALLYLTFGINRIARRAGKLRRRRRALEARSVGSICAEEALTTTLGPDHAHLVSISRVADRLTGRKLLEGNGVTMLVNGEEAYPAMLEAIRQAKRSVALQSYIFANDEVGLQFVDVVADARKRGCQVRVSADYVGSHYSLSRAFEKAGVPFAIFLPPVLIPLKNRYMNLRNHRKILVCDGQVGFTGGMNIRKSHLLKTPGQHHEQDTHFRLEGPVVSHLMDAFADDWAFVAGEVLTGPDWYTPIEKRGEANARGVAFDPGENLDLLRLVVGAAISSARQSIRIVSPYFIPEPPVITALNVAALRGVTVDILIPEKNDSQVMQWAIQAMLWQVLGNGCRVWMTKEPFDHTKLMVVDEGWVFLGSMNMDTRSMRLNFEFNVESYDRELARIVTRHIEAKMQAARRITLKQVDARPLGIKLRDGVARLFSPYL
ncbi:MAG TPA: cardiolipin synthase [Planctomycetota bacterium]|nr:cardiolipin synthase [Planctomycetota bacterium]